MVAVLEVLRIVEAVEELAHLTHEIAEVLPRNRHLLHALHLRETAAWLLKQWVEPVAEEGRQQGHQRTLAEELSIAWMHLITLLEVQRVAFRGSVLAAQLRSEISCVLKKRSRFARLLRITDAVYEVRVDQDRVAR